MTTRETELLAENAALKEQLSEANKERAWVRRKLEIPEDTGFLSGDVTLAGTMHNVWSGYRGYHKYIAAEKCDDKMGKIARQSVEIDSLKGQVAQLEAEVMRLRNALETELATLKAENKWQPIETAPKDEAVFLAWRKPRYTSANG